MNPDQRHTDIHNHLAGLAGDLDDQHYPGQIALDLRALRALSINPMFSWIAAGLSAAAALFMAVMLIQFADQPVAPPQVVTVQPDPTPPAVATKHAKQSLTMPVVRLTPKLAVGKIPPFALNVSKLKHPNFSLPRISVRLNATKPKPRRRPSHDKEQGADCMYGVGRFARRAHDDGRRRIA